jgi:phage terminase large subunit-like protein
VSNSTTTSTPFWITTKIASLAAMSHSAAVDPNRFLQLCLPTPQAELHRSMQKFLSRNPKALVELPRDHGKTTQVCLRIAWELGRNPMLRVKLVCSSDRLAIDRLLFIRRQIERNPILRLVFPLLRPGKPWATDGFTIARPGDAIGPSVAAFGIGSASTGTRADLLVCDDIVDVAAIHSRAERDRVSAAFHDNLLNLLEPDGRFWGLFTPWHADDCNARLKRNGAYAHFRRAIGPDLEPVWPEKWPTDKLAERKREIGEAAFARGYRLTPIAESEILVRPEWVRTWTEPADRDFTLLAVDPATSARATADRTACVVLGRAGTEIRCLAAIARRLAAPELVPFLDEMDRAWNPQVILFESNGAFATLKDLLVRHARFGPKIKGVVQSRRKADRVAAFAVSVENGSFRLADGQGELFDEMTTFPFGERDDLVDAAAMGTAYLLTGVAEPRIWV